MQKTIKIIGVMAALALVMASCTQTEETGRLQFGTDLSGEQALKSTGADPNVTEALVTIVGENGDVLFEKEPLRLYRFGDRYATNSLKLPVGEYRLTEFMLIDSMGVVLWATPKEGSNLAHMVQHPLTIPFHIGSDETTSLDIQVVRVKEYQPSDFGYADFIIGFVDRFCLKVFYSSRCVPEWNDSILTVDGTFAPVYQPMLTIRAGDRVLVNEPLVPGLNKFEVPFGPEWYRFTATDCRGVVIYEELLPVDELLRHRCGDQFEPLMIVRDPEPGILITPEGLQEPTIKQGVFGRIELPLDSFMLEDQANAWPFPRDIYFFPYAVMDSIYTVYPDFGPIDCYFRWPGELPPPVAAVRTNSDGFFQVPLAPGEYLYLVKEGDQWFFNPIISSQRPGYVKVSPGEVTELIIHLVDCSMWM